MSTPEAKRQKMDMNGCNGNKGHGYGFDVGVNYEESSVSTFSFSFQFPPIFICFEFIEVKLPVARPSVVTT